MGKYVNGINGAFTGKVGNIIGSSWRGIPYMKSRSYRTKPATEGEKINRFIFGMTQQWLKPLKEFLRIGFNNYTLTNQGVNAAKSFLYKNALIKDGFDSFIDPALAKVSHGDLPLPARMDVELNSQNKLIFTWDPKSKEANDLDQVMLLAYDIENGEAAMKILGQFRETGRDELSVSFLNNFVVYAAFVSADRNTQSDSVYLGSFTTVDSEEPEEKTDSESKTKVKDKPASSTEKVNSTTSGDDSAVEEVSENQPKSFEPLDEGIDNQIKADRSGKENNDYPDKHRSGDQAETEGNSKDKKVNSDKHISVNQAEPDANITDNENHSDTQTSMNQYTADKNIRDHESNSDIQVSVDLSLKEENLQNATLPETKAEPKQEILDKPPLTKSKGADKQKFTYINPNIEIEGEIAESHEIRQDEPGEKVVIKKGKVTYVISKKHLDKTTLGTFK